MSTHGLNSGNVQEIINTPYSIYSMVPHIIFFIIKHFKLIYVFILFLLSLDSSHVNDD